MSIAQEVMLHCAAEAAAPVGMTNQIRVTNHKRKGGLSAAHLNYSLATNN